MCDASTLASLAQGAQVAGAVSGAIGSYRQSKAQQDAYEYQSAVAGTNAKLAEIQARDAIERGQRSEADHRLKVAKLRGSQRASLAARGVALDEGSPLSLLQDTDYFGEMDALTIRDNAAREAWASRAQATNYSADAGMLRNRAEAESPLMAGGMSLLTGAGQVASSWYNRKTRTSGAY